MVIMDRVEIGGDIYNIDGNIVQNSSAEDVQVNTKASKTSPQSAKESHGVPDQYIQMLTHAGNLQCREWSKHFADDVHEDRKATELVRKEGKSNSKR